MPAFLFRDPTQPLPHEVVANVAASKNIRNKRKLPVALISVAGVVLAAIIIIALVLAFS